VSPQDEHSSFIRTPKQLIVVVLLAFLVPVIGIYMVVQLVTSRPIAEPGSMSPEVVAARIQPVGRVSFGEDEPAPTAVATAPKPAALRTGEQIVKTVCAACHQAGVADAPRLGDRNAWAKLIAEGLEHLVENSIKGIRAMPPRGGDATLTDLEVERAVVYMANLAGANFKEPAVKEQATPEIVRPEAPKPAAKPAAAEGKKIYDTACVACHVAGVAGAPKLGDKAAWAPRIQAGTDSMVQAVMKGKGAMPPRAGNPSLTEEQARAAVEYMVEQSK
jgi:cytochrome c5